MEVEVAFEGWYVGKQEGVLTEWVNGKKAGICDPGCKTGRGYEGE